MCTNTVLGHLPSEWSYKILSDYNDGDYKLVELSPHTSQYRTLQSQVKGSFNLGISKIVRVENPYLYGQFLIQKEEYETRGPVRMLQLYHDTDAFNIPSIVRNNLDWRMANRVKYGKGVSFSPLPSYANKESSRNNGTARAMIIADVLVQREQRVNTSVNLPNAGYDTTVGNLSNVYVKYFDNVFYPKYVVYYTSKPYVRRGNRFVSYDDLYEPDPLDLCDYDVYEPDLLDLYDYDDVYEPDLLDLYDYDDVYEPDLLDLYDYDDIH